MSGNNNSNNSEEDFFNKYTPQIIFLFITYIIVAILGGNSGDLPWLNGFYHYLSKNLELLFPFFMLFLIGVWGLSLYTFIQKKNPNKIDFSDPNTIAVTAILALSSIFILNCYCLFPFCLLFIYYSIKDAISLYSKYNKIPSSSEIQESEFNTYFQIFKNYETLSLARIMSTDGSFNEDTFKNRIKKSYRLLNQCIYKKNLKEIELSLSDALFIKLNNKFNESDFDFAGFNNPNITDIAIIKKDIDKKYDTIIAAIKANSEDNLHKLFLDTTEIKNSVVLMKLTRKKGERSKISGTLEGHCPNCNKKINESGLYKCPSCDKIIRSAKYDWLITDIDLLDDNPEEYIDKIQLEEKKSSLKNIKNILKYDTEFSINNIEDKIQYMFWNILYAHNNSMKDLVTSFTTKELSKNLFQAYLNNVFSNSIGVRILSIEIKGMYTENNKDILVSTINWRGRPFKESTLSMPFTTYFILTRNAHVSTESELHFCSSFCPNCLKKLYARKENCKQCNTILNNGDTGWVLTDVLSFEHSKTKTYLRNINKSSYKAAKETASEANLLFTDNHETINLKTSEKETNKANTDDFKSFYTQSTTSYSLDDFITKEKETEQIVDEYVSANETEEVSNMVAIDESTINIEVSTDDSIEDIIEETNLPTEIEHDIEENKDYSDIINIDINDETTNIDKVSSSSIASSKDNISGRIIPTNTTKDIGINKVEINDIRIDNNTGISDIKVKPVEINKISLNSVDISPSTIDNNITNKSNIIETSKTSNSSLSNSKTSLLGTISIGSSGIDLTKRIDIASTSILSNVNVSPISINPIKLDTYKKDKA